MKAKTTRKREATHRNSGARGVLAVSLLLLGASACKDEVTAPELRECQPASKNHLLNTNEEIRSFSGCQILKGSLQMDPPYTDPSPLDLSPLSSLIIIEGGISGGGFNTTPFSLDALHNLEEVGGDLHFLEDNVLGFDGLVKLRAVGGWLRLVNVPELENLHGLERVRSLSRLDVQYNPKLKTLAGLDGLTEVKGNVTIKGNELLPDAEIDALLERITVGGTIDRD